MTPRVLVMGRKPGIVEAVHEKFGAQPVTWAYIQSVAMLPRYPFGRYGGGVGLRYARTSDRRDHRRAPNVTIHLKDRASAVAEVDRHVSDKRGCGMIITTTPTIDGHPIKD